MEFFSKNIFFFFLFFIFQIIGVFYWLHDFDKYLIVSFFLSFYFFKLMVKPNYNVLVLLFLYLLLIFYSVYLCFDRNPLKYFNNKSIIANEYVLENIANKGYPRGDLGEYPIAGLDNISINGYIVRSNELNKYILLSCSTLNQGCQDSSKIGDTVFVKHLKDKKPLYYVFYSKQGDLVLNEAFYLHKYKDEFKVKLNFIFFYLICNFLFLLFMLIRNGQIVFKDLINSIVLLKFW